MAPLRFGLVGTGAWALSTHGPGLATSAGATLEGVWGRDPARSAEAARQLGTRAYTDLDELLGAVDAVAFAVPPDVQAPLAVRAAQAGCHLLLEKPLALSVPSARSVVAAAAEADVATLVFFTARFRPELERWSEAAAGAGPWHSAHAVHYANIFQPGNPFGTSPWRRKEGALWDVGPHALAALLPLMGPVSEVAARRGPAGSDTVHLVLSHAAPPSEGAGGTSTVSLSLTMPPGGAALSLAVYGEAGAWSRPDTHYEAAETFGRAVSTLARMAGEGAREHPCDASFGFEVVKTLAAAQAALDLPAVRL